MGSAAAGARAVRPLPEGFRPEACVRVPGSKSLTNRALVVAALATGRTLLRGALWGDDSEACVVGLRAAGVTVRADPGAGEIEVEGRGAGPPAPQAEIDVRLSGTTARFLCPYLALGRGTYRVDGTPRMRQRPMGPVVDGLRAQGVRVDGGPGLPLVIHGAGGLAGGELEVAGDETSQAASGFLLCGPFSARDLHLRIRTQRAGLPYVRMTVAVMEAFGVRCAELPGGGYGVPAGARYAGGERRIEADASSAAYFWAAAALTGGRVHTPGIGRSRLQGDAALLGILAEMGATVEDGPGGATVTGPAGGALRGGCWDLGSCSDQALTVAALGLFCDRPTTVTGVAHIRLQESDRIAAAAEAVARLGGRLEEQPAGFTVWPAPPGAETPARIDPHGDHRVAMAFALAGLRRPGVAIEDPGVVTKTFPGFWDELGRLSPPGA